MIDSMLSPVRLALQRQVRRITGDSRKTVDFTRPAGDPGWFGPDAVCWTVHADFISMLTGGIRALLLQALHPLAMAGVWDYSGFRDDLPGRLARTAQFIATTTYGGTAVADAAVTRVRTIHAQVRGTAPDGTPYAADAPELLRFVHIAEVGSFLAAYEWLVRPLPDAQADRYFAETARVALALGAQTAPSTRHSADAELDAFRPALHPDARSAEVLRLLRRPAGFGAEAFATRIMVEAGIALLPDWARSMYGLPPTSALRKAALRATLQPGVALMRWALTDGVAALARQRALALPEASAGTARRPR